MENALYQDVLKKTLYIKGSIEKELNHRCISSRYPESYKIFTQHEGNLLLILWCLTRVQTAQKNPLIQFRSVVSQALALVP